MDTSTVEALAATGWGFLGGIALVIGAAVGWFVRLPATLVASVMAFGAGVLISALAFDLVAEAAAEGGTWPVIVGFAIGAVLYWVANEILARRGAKHRKRSQDLQPSEDEHAGSGTAIAIGALLDGVPESVVLGASLLGGTGVSVVMIVAVFVSNLPEGLSSAVGMKNSGRSARYVFGVWAGIAVASAIAAGLGYLALGDAAPETVGIITAVAAGAMLTMIADTMIPEAVEQRGTVTGLIVSLGFLSAFTIHQLGG